MKNFEEFNFNKTYGTSDTQCKPCKNDPARESAERKKYDTKMRKMIKEAKDNGDTSSVQCKRCKRYMPHSTFMPYDTRVFVNNELLLDGYTEICGYCITFLNDKVFSHIAGAIKYANEKQLKKRTKANSTKVS